MVNRILSCARCQSRYAVDGDWEPSHQHGPGHVTISELYAIPSPGRRWYVACSDAGCQHADRSPYEVALPRGSTVPHGYCVTFRPLPLTVGEADAVLAAYALGGVDVLRSLGFGLAHAVYVDQRPGLA